MALKTLFIFLSVFLIAHNLHGRDAGFKYFKNYSYIEYDHHAQNWGMVQAENGIIHVANQAGVLEFDGASWRVIKVPDYNPVRSMAIDETGTIYIGGNNEIGYLAPDKVGTLKYYSLCSYLPDSQKKFSNVWKTYAIGKHVYFYTSSFLFRWEPGRKILTGLPHAYKAFLSCGKKLYIRGDKDGLEQMVQMERDGLKTVPVAGGEIFAEKRIYMMTPYKSNSPNLLIGTYQNGIYIHDGKTTTPFLTEVDDYLKKNKLYHGIRLSSGDFALATLLGGLVVISPRGRLKYIFDKTSGLQDDKVYYVFEDNRGNLWLCLNKGISKIEYDSPISIHDERSHLEGMVLSVTRHRGNLYVGTANGLYFLESPFKFRPVPGIYGDCWSLLSTRDSLLAAISEGVFQVIDKNRGVKKIIDEQSFALFPSVWYPGRTWCGTNRGLVTLSLENGQWREEHRITGIDQGVRSIVEDRKGGLWLGTSTGSILKVDFPAAVNQPVVTPYYRSHGLPEGEIYITVAAGHVMFATGEGIYRFEEKENKFIHDQTLGTEFVDRSRPVFRVAEDINKNIWFHSESRNYQAIPAPGGSFTIHSKPFRRIPAIQVNTIYPDPDGKTIWFGCFEGLIRYDTMVRKDYLQDFKTFVRRVFIKGELIFDGYKNKEDYTSKNLFPIIEYKKRNLHFEFAAPFFDGETETRYQCFLEGYDDDWSAWDTDNKKYYTNLDSGLYSFRVRAKNIYEKIGGEDVFQFKILLPWYKTWWAFLAYASLFFILSYLVVKWQRSIRLEKEKQKLEQIVKERTKEISEKNQQLESQTLTLQNQSEKLKEMDKVKSRFFANISHEFRTPLTLIMGPLEKMLSKNRDRERDNELKMMLRNSRRLLRLINRLLDLSKLDSGKMKLNAVSRDIVSFIKGIVAGFESLALQNRVDLNLNAAEAEIVLPFDPEKLEEVLCNLLINALKFTPPGGKVTVSAGSSCVEGDSFANGYFELSVCDTGVGIPRDKLVHIFDRFYQTGDSKQPNHKGSGIGLALTKELVLLHHGKIDVHSSGGENSGTEFVIRLPLGEPRLGSAETGGETGAIPIFKSCLDIHTQYIIEDEENVTVETPEPVDENGKARDKNIVLVVEDNADVRKYIRGPLEPHYTVVEAKNGREGIDKAKDIIPDLIVSDIMMPEVDGYELCRVLKKDVKTSHIPIILLTAKASEQSVIEGLETGADDYITKPFNTKILMTRIRNLIELRLQLQQKIQKQMLLQPAEISVSSVDREFIKELQQVIEKHLADPEFHVEALSEKLYMNRVTLYRKIIALTGESPTQFIRAYRLKRAAQLLRDNAGNVSEVALEVGFSNLGYFTRCFKKKFHQLPSTYQASEST